MNTNNNNRNILKPYHINTATRAINPIKNKRNNITVPP